MFPKLFLYCLWSVCGFDNAPHYTLWAGLNCAWVCDNVHHTLLGKGIYFYYMCHWCGKFSQGNQQYMIAG